MCLWWAWRSSEIKVPFNIVDDFLVYLNFSSDHKTVEQFVLLEQAPANVDVETLGNVFDEQVYSILKDLFLLCDLESPFEQFHKIVQRILIHRVDDAKVTYDEINNTASFSDWSVLLSGLVDLLTCYFGHLNTLIYRLWSDFGYV